MSYYTPAQHDQCIEFYLANPGLSVAECIRRIQVTVPGLEKYSKTAFYRLLDRRGLIDVQKGKEKHVHTKPLLNPEEEAICVDFRRSRLLSTDECFQGLRKLFPNLTNANLKDIFKRHGVNNVLKLKPRKPPKKSSFWDASVPVENRNHVKRLLIAARGRARERGMEFDLTLADLEWTGFCPVFGIPLVPGKGKASFASPSLDRIDNTKGYVKGNVIIVCLRVNTIKSSATPEELSKVAEFYTALKKSDS